MAHHFAYQEDEKREPFPEDFIFQEMLKRGQATSTPVSEILADKFRRSVRGMLDVEVGPALEGPYTDEQIGELAADYAEGEIKEAVS